MAAYEEGRDEEANEENQERESKLPKLEVGQKVQAVEVTAKDHQTSPPARYTEATLVKALEEDGIGRPSTYASILSTIVNKGYVTKRGQALVPEWIAFTVTRFLENNFDYLIDYEFTASMELDLDQIAEGKLDNIGWLKEFFFGDESHPGLTATAQNILEQDNRAINSFELSEGLTLRTGKFGPYLEVRGEPGEPGVDETGRRIINIPEGLAPDELTSERAKELIEAPVVSDKVLGEDPSTGFEILFKDGRYGPYVVLNDPAAAKPKTASLFKSMDPAAISLEEALQLLSLPREVGVDTEDGKPITAQNGPYGPYLKKGNDSRQLTTEQQIFEITLDEAIALYKLPKTRGRQAAANAPLKEFAADPASGTPVLVKTGQFGTYVTDGFVNATLPKEEPVDELSADRAYELLAIRREKLGLAPGEALAKTKRSGGKRAPTGGAKRAKAKKK
jgi:DNA topoisomerase-1